MNGNNLSKILTYYNRNVAENDKASSEKLSERGVHKVKVDFSQCTDQLIRSNNIPHISPISQTLYPVAVYQLPQKSAGAYLLDQTSQMYL